MIIFDAQYFAPPPVSAVVHLEALRRGVWVVTVTRGTRGGVKKKYLTRDLKLVEPEIPTFPQENIIFSSHDEARSTADCWEIAMRETAAKGQTP